MIRIPSDHAVFSWTYKTYKSIITIEIDDILMATHNKINIEILTQELDTLFDYTLQQLI